MIAKIRPLRFAAFLCILATFPALGQVENATDVDTADRASPQQRTLPAAPFAPDQPAQAIPALRLVASAPDLVAMPNVQFVAPGNRPVARPRRAGAAATPAPVVPGAINDPLAPDLVRQRIAALSAVPLTAPPMPQEPSVTTPDFLAHWIEMTSAYLHSSWRQAGLVAALVIAAGLLFWRLGERSRHADPELMLDEMAPEPAAMREESPANPGDTLERALLQRERDDLLVDDPFADHAMTSRPQFATLRDAIAAMNADMTHAGGQGRREVEA